MSGNITGLHVGDARDLTRIPTGSVACVVTSPPYLAQRRYGASPLEIGREGSLRAFVLAVADVFDGLRRVLRPDGLAWLNIGDKANGSGGAGGDWTPGRKGRRAGGGPSTFRDPDYLDGTFLDVPGALLRELLLRGWRLRLPIVWDKGRQAPEDLNHVRRPRWQHETIYLLAPSKTRSRFFPERLTETGSVWRFPAGGQGPSHLAPFPDELARRCILPSTEPGDLVFDPFAGSGTTIRVANQLGRRGLGFDLYVAPTEALWRAEARGYQRGKAAAETEALELAP